MVKIIINADDLGKDHETNLAIEDALKKGCITSSTIMANSTTWDDVHRIVEGFPNASFGVHLNLTEGRALSDGKVLREYGIVDDNFCFTKKSRKILEVNKELEEAIFDEWDSQINKVVNIEEIKITHIDGHHHIHMNAAYTNILSRLVVKYHIGFVRRKHNSWKSKSPKETISGLVTNAVCSVPFVRNLAGKLSQGMKLRINNQNWLKIVSGVTHFTDYFNGYEQAIDFVRGGSLPSTGSVIELMCHPGHPSFVNEYNKVQEHEIEKLIKDVELSSYQSI